MYMLSNFLSCFFFSSKFAIFYGFHPIHCCYINWLSNNLDLRWGLTFCWASSGTKLFAKVIQGLHSSLAVLYISIYQSPSLCHSDACSIASIWRLWYTVSSKGSGTICKIVKTLLSAKLNSLQPLQTVFGKTWS